MNGSRTVYSSLNERSCRNTLGYLLFAISTILPTIAYWQSGGDQVPLHRPQWSVDRPRSHPLGPWPGTGERSDTGTRVAVIAWWLVRAAFAALGTTIAMAVLLPYPGCKRFALLLGAPTGLAAMTASSLWLAGRTEVYRFEPVLAGIVGAIPTGFLWLQCCKWSFDLHNELPAPDVPYVIGDEDLVE